MKYLLSHNQTEVIQWTGIVSPGILTFFITCISIKLLPFFWSITFALSISLLMFYFSRKIFKAQFDECCLYLTRRLNKKKIDLNDIIDVRTFPFSFYLFFGQAYVVSVSYIESNKRKNAFFISRALYSWTPTIKSLSAISQLRQFIHHKKRNGKSAVEKPGVSS